MMHQMKLQQSPFAKIKNGSKTIELRLNDEKHRQVKVGDFIEFSLLGNPKEKIQTRVTALHRFDTLRELYSAFPKEKIGYDPSETPDPDHMDGYYSREKQEQYGVLGIELRMTDLQKFIDAQDYGYSLNHRCFIQYYHTFPYFMIFFILFKIIAYFHFISRYYLCKILHTKELKIMKATGIVRRIDDLGRVVIPKEIRRTMRIREGDPSQTTLENPVSYCYLLLVLAKRLKVT